MSAKSVASAERPSSRVQDNPKSVSPAIHPAALEVKRRMEAAGLGVRALADKAGIDNGGLSKILTGKIAEPKVTQLAKLAAALGTTLPELLGFEAATGNGQAMVALEDIREGNNVRTDYDDDGIDWLAGSIKALGLLQPLGVRPLDHRGYVTLVYGYRRYEAIGRLCEDGDWDPEAATVPVVFVDDDASEKDRILAQLAENLAREDMSPLDEGEAYRQLIDVEKMDSGEIADQVGKSRRTIQDRAKLARDLCDRGKGMLRLGTLTAAQASALILAPNGKGQQQTILDRIVNGEPGLSTEAGIRQALGLDRSAPAGAGDQPAAADDPDDLLGPFKRERTGTQPDGSFTLMGAEETAEVMNEPPIGETADDDDQLDIEDAEWDGPDAHGVYCEKKANAHVAQTGNPVTGHRHDYIKILAIETADGWIAAPEVRLWHSGTGGHSSPLSDDRPHHATEAEAVAEVAEAELLNLERMATGGHLKSVAVTLLPTLAKQLLTLAGREGNDVPYSLRSTTLRDRYAKQPKEGLIASTRVKPQAPTEAHAVDRLGHQLAAAIDEAEELRLAISYTLDEVAEEEALAWLSAWFHGDEQAKEQLQAYMERCGSASGQGEESAA